MSIGYWNSGLLLLKTTSSYVLSLSVTFSSNVVTALWKIARDSTSKVEYIVLGGHHDAASITNVDQLEVNAEGILAVKVGFSMFGHFQGLTRFK